MASYFGFQWHITNACDQRCRHCYIYNGDGMDSAAGASWQDMEDILANIKDFGRRFDRLPYLFVTGGDPLLHPLFWNLTERLAAGGIPYTILGNPFHLTPAVCARLRQTGCEQYQLSLDGLERTHDRMRKPGSFQETLARLPMLKQAGISTVVMATVSAVNLAEMVPLMELLSQHETDLFAFARFCDTGSRGGNGIEPLAYRNLLDEMYRLAQELPARGSAMRLSFKDHLWTLYTFEEGLFQIPETAVSGIIYDGCHCGASHLTILPDGTVYACRRMESPVGNALSDKLTDIWLSDRMERYRDFQAFEKCSGCELLAWCRGCPAVSAAETGGFYAADPQCWKDMAP